MLSRAAYLVLLEAELTARNAARKAGRALLLAAGDELLPDEPVLPPAGGWRDTSTTLGMLRFEISELKKRLGGAERREYQRLQAGQ